MAIFNAKLLPSATITLLAPALIPATARAQVLTRGADACPGTQLEPGVSNYDLRVISGSIESNLPLIAVEARVPSVYAAHSFHLCSTSGGFHLTAWDGARPLEGRRLWHQYYELENNLPRDCTISEKLP